MNNIKKIGIIACRFLVVLFRKDRTLRKLYLEYPQEHLFKNGYFIINYRFRNALYYRLGKDILTDKFKTVVNLAAYNHEIEFEVVGFFHRKIYRINVDSSLMLDSEKFTTRFNNLQLSDVALPSIGIVQREIAVYDKVPTFSPTPITIRRQSPKFNKPIFNQTDFI